MNFIDELKRRNVFRVGLAYALIAWVVLQVIDFLLELTDAPAWVLQVFFITAIVGLPMVLILSWVYEMTPEGIRLEKDVDRSRSITSQTGRKLDRLIIAFLAVTVALLVAGHFYSSPSGTEVSPEPVAEAQPEAPAEAQLPSIAVLPFVNMSSDPEQDYFADGISEEILNSLARVSGLKVAGRTSAFAFKGKNEDLRLIGEALGVENILEGSVRKQGDQVRITAQLVQVADGFHLWSDTYDRTLNDIFAIQDEIANAILQQTRIQLLEGESITSIRVNPIAYQNYVAAKQRIHERTKGGLKVAMNLLRDAVELDPGFAGAWAQLGIATMLSSDGFGSYGDIPEKEANRTGREYLERSLELDPALAEGLAGMGLYYQNVPPQSHQQILQSLDVLERSISIDPSDINASLWLSRAYGFLGRAGESQELLERMVERDPLYWPAVSNLVFMYATKNRMLEAHQLNDRTMRYRPELPFRQKAFLLSMDGQFADALPMALEVWAERSDSLTYGAVALAHAGVNQFEALADLEGAPDTRWRSAALAYLGRSEEALLTAQTELSEYGDPDALIEVLVLTGQFPEIVAFMAERWPDLEVFELEHGDGGGFGNRVMLDVALAYDRTGNDGKFRAAMSLVRASHDEQKGHGFDTMYLDMAEAEYFALAGDQEQALGYLQAAVDRGYSAAPRLSKLHPQLASLEGIPRYEELQSRSLAHLNEQRALLELEPLESAY